MKKIYPLVITAKDRGYHYLIRIKNVQLLVLITAAGSTNLVRWDYVVLGWV